VQMLSKAEELVTISDYIINEWIRTTNGKLNLHLPTEQEETSFLDDLLGESYTEDYLIRSMLVLTEAFHATTFAYQLLSESNLYYTDVSGESFHGEYYAHFEDGKFSYWMRPKKGFIQLIKENVGKWSTLIKPHALKVLATSKENKIQRLRLFFEDYFIELYIFPDGRFYFFSAIDENNLKAQLDAFNNFEKLITELIDNNYPDHSITFLPIEIRKKRAREFESFSET